MAACASMLSYLPACVSYEDLATLHFSAWGRGVHLEVSSTSCGTLNHQSLQGSSWTQKNNLPWFWTKRCSHVWAPCAESTSEDVCCCSRARPSALACFDYNGCFHFLAEGKPGESCPLRGSDVFNVPWGTAQVQSIMASSSG